MEVQVLTSEGGAGTSQLCDVKDDRDEVESVSSERDWKLREGKMNMYLKSVRAHQSSLAGTLSSACKNL